jgi:hypothetical protein
LPRLVHKEVPRAPTPDLVENWGSFQRKAYALTQVCRKIRREFLPLYRKEVKVRINIEDVDHYLTYAVQTAVTDPTSAYGNISIDITNERSVNLQDVLLLHDRAPDLHLSFTHPERESDMMSILLDADRWPEFHAFIAEKTSRVVLTIHFDDFIGCGYDSSEDSDSELDEKPEENWKYPYTQSCTLFVKEEFAEMWMKRSWHGSDRWRDGLYQWEADLGLKDRKKVRCVIRPEAEHELAHSLA